MSDVPPDSPDQSPSPSQPDRQFTDPIFLRVALANALARRGFERISIPAATVTAPKLSHGPAELLIICWWASSYTLAVALGLPLVLAIFMPPTLFILGGALVEKRIGGVILSLTVAAPFVALIYSTIWDHELLLRAFLAPSIVVLAFALLARVLVSAIRDFPGFVAGITRGTPLIAPLVLVFLLFPLMTRDLWEVAAAMSIANLMSISFLTLAATYTIVYFKLKSEIERVSEIRVANLCANEHRGVQTRRMVTDALGSKDEWSKKVDRMTDETIDRWWPLSASEYSPYLASIERKSLSAPLKFRLALTTFAFLAVLFAYVYAIARLGIPTETIDSWIGTPQTEGSIFGMTISADEYIKTSALAAVLGTAGFLAFTMIEERFSTELTTALIRRPLDQFLALAIPFVHLEELFGGIDLEMYYSDDASSAGEEALESGSTPD